MSKTRATEIFSQGLQAADATERFRIGHVFNGYTSADWRAEILPRNVGSIFHVHFLCAGITDDAALMDEVRRQVESHM